MNPDYEHILAAEVDRQLKALPNLRAPAELSARVMANIDHRQVRSPAWVILPLPVRLLAIAVMLAGFVAVCLLSAHFREAIALELEGALRVLWQPFSTAVNLMGTLGSACLVVLKNLSTFVLTALLIMAAVAYFVWVYLGTLWFRIAFRRC